jgi:hypothetical protein
MTEFPALGIFESESKRADEAELVDEGAFGDEVVDGVELWGWDCLGREGLFRWRWVWRWRVIYSGGTSVTRECFERQILGGC